MNKWSIAYLFRAAEDGGVFPSFSLIHLALILFAAAQRSKKITVDTHGHTPR